MRPTQSQVIQAFFFTLVLINALWFGFKPLTPDQLSGDQVNIISICQIFDQPGAWESDLLGQAPEDLRYYTPWYIGFIRLCGKLCGGDYLKAHQWLTFLTILVYVGGWFWFFKLFCRWHVALTMAWLCKGILWPPGNEIWGVAGVWTLLPRTIFFAGLPWLLGAAFRLKSRWNGMLFLAGGLGLLTQIHPISGLGCVLVFITTLGWIFASRRIWLGWKWMVQFALILGLTLSPYVWVYTQHVLLDGMQTTGLLDPQDLALRIPDYLINPSAYFAKWLSLKWLCFFGGSTSILLVFRKRLCKQNAQVCSLCIGILIASMCLAFLPFFLQLLLQQFGLKTNFAFQLIRNGRLCLIPGFCLWALVLNLVGQNMGKMSEPLLPFGLLALTLIAATNRFPNVPLLGDDILRQQWPIASLGPENAMLQDALIWIDQNTAKTSVFVGPRLLRVFPKRAVVHEMAGAGLLIEGNPARFHDVCQRERSWQRAKTWVEKSALAEQWGAQYILARKGINGSNAVYQNSTYLVLKIDSFANEAGSLIPDPKQAETPE